MTNRSSLYENAKGVDAALSGLQKASLAPPNVAIVSGDGVEPLVDVVDGRELQWVRGRSATTRALYAADLYTGKKQLGRPTQIQSRSAWRFGAAR
jgi:hypothetical protein